MTERLYYTDAYLTEFDAVVQSIEHAGAGSRVALDRTAFYPASGGQPCDTGRLGGLPVLDVLDKEDGAVVHVVKGTLDLGQPVNGTIDWSRRFDHMQQHSGQHLLSAAFDRLHRVPTVSFHLGAAASTIDLDRDLSIAAIAAAVDEANRIVWENRPVTVRFVTEQEATDLPLRKVAARPGPLRLVDMDRFDLSACGGTHVARTGEVGIIAVLSTERFKGGLRLEFVCGRRALRSFDALRDAMTGSVRLLSVLPSELPAAIERVQSDQKELGRTIKGLREQLAAHEADRLAAKGQPIAGHTLVAERIDDWDAAGLKALATALALRDRHVAALCSGSAPSVVVISRAPDVPVDAAAVLRVLTSRFGGRGGGRSELAQGGGLNGPAQDIVAAARDALSAALTDAL